MARRVHEYGFRTQDFPDQGPCEVLRDGEVLARVETPDDAFVWLLRNQGMSVMYALRWGGYSVREAQDD